jgi:hypothetical protein
LFIFEFPQTDPYYQYALIINTPLLSITQDVRENCSAACAVVVEASTFRPKEKAGIQAKALSVRHVGVAENER